MDIPTRSISPEKSIHRMDGIPVFFLLYTYRPYSKYLFLSSTATGAQFAMFCLDNRRARAHTYTRSLALTLGTYTARSTSFHAMLHCHRHDCSSRVSAGSNFLLRVLSYQFIIKDNTQPPRSLDVVKHIFLILNR